MPDQASTCTLCTDSEATERLEATGDFRRFLTRERNVDEFTRPVIVPLCDECHGRLEELDKAVLRARGCEDTATAKSSRLRVWEQLDITAINAASR